MTTIKRIAFWVFLIVVFYVLVTQIATVIFQLHYNRTATVRARQIAKEQIQCERERVTKAIAAIESNYLHDAMSTFTNSQILDYATNTFCTVTNETATVGGNIATLPRDNAL
ncbi:MAG: hypothetical protein ACOX5G_12570 [Kiritimatiellia bacterium]|jgi:signal transduction histidine kinase